MASILKEITKSIAGTVQATNAVTQSIANIAVSASNSAVTIVDSVGTSVTNLGLVSNEYSADLVLDAKASSKENGIKRTIKIKALELVAKDEDVMAKAVDATAKSLIADLLEDLD